MASADKQAQDIIRMIKSSADDQNTNTPKKHSLVDGANHNHHKARSLPTSVVAAVSSSDESSSDTDSVSKANGSTKNRRSASKKTDPKQKEGLQHLITLAFQKVRNQVSSGIRHGAVLVTQGGHVFAAHNLRNENGGAVVPAERTAVIKAVCEGYTDFKAVVICSDQAVGFPIPCAESCQLLATYGDFDIFACNATRQYERYGTKALWKQVKTDNARLLDSAQTALNRDLPGAPSTDSLGAAGLTDVLASGTTRSRPAFSPEPRMTHRSIATVANWSGSQVSRWLRRLGMAAYIPTFQQHAVDGSALLQLNEGYLETKMSITNIKMRKRLVFAIAALKDHMSGASSLRQLRPASAPTNREPHNSLATPIMASMDTTGGTADAATIAQLKEEFDRVDVTRSGTIPLHSAHTLIQKIRASKETRMTFADVVQTLTSQENVPRITAGAQHSDSPKRSTRRYSFDDTAATEKGALVALPKEEQNFTVGIGQTIVKNITSMYAGQFDRFGIGDYDTEIVTVIPYPENGVISVTGLSPGITEFKLMIGLNGIEHGGEDVTDELDIQVRVKPKFDLQGAFQKMCRKGSETLSFARAAEAIALLGYRISKHSIAGFVAHNSTREIDFSTFTRIYKSASVGQLESHPESGKSLVDAHSESGTDETKSSEDSPEPPRRSRRRRRNKRQKKHNKTSRKNPESKVPPEYEYAQGAGSASRIPTASSSMGRYPFQDYQYQQTMNPYQTVASNQMGPFGWMNSGPVTGYAGSHDFFNLDSRLRPGSVVEARYQGASKWFPGKIVGRNANGTFDILYDDGDMEYNVHPEFVREQTQSSQTDSNDTDSSVSEESDQETSDVEKQRPKRRRKNERIKRKKSRNRDPQIHSDTGEENQSRSGTETTDNEEFIQEGARVEALYNGTRWERGKLESKTRRRGVVRFDHGATQRLLLSNIRVCAPYPAPRSQRKHSRAKRSTFARNMKVQARARGSKRWMNARVTDVLPNGRYNVLFDNHHRESNLQEKFIMLRNDDETMDETMDETSSELDEPATPRSDPKIKVGSRLMARLNRKWRPVTVVRARRNGCANVKDRQGKLFRDLRPELLKTKKQFEKEQKKKTGGFDSDTIDDDSRTRKRSSTDSDSANGSRDDDGASEFQKGATVEARYAGKSKWCKGKIARANSNGTYSVKYLDGRKEREVKKRHIRLEKRSTSSSSSSSSSSSDSDDNDGKLKVGTAIEARYGGKSKWYKGKISRANSNGTYDVLYSDGDKERGVKKHLIRKVGGSSKKSKDSDAGSDDDDDDDKLKVGTAIEARYGGKSKWYKGKISKVNYNGTYDVLYSDGDKERGVKKHLIRKVGGSSKKSKDSDAGSDDDDDDGKLKVGTAIEARYGGKSKWYKGKISRANSNGTYDVLYSDGDKERGVKKHLIRKVNDTGSRFNSRSNQNTATRNSRGVAFDIKF